MSMFRGGPADGVTLMFARGPMFLRVVVDEAGGFDVLDMPEDEPREGEQVHVYRRVGESRPAHLTYRGSPKGRSGWYEFAEYEYVELPDDVLDGLRETEAWREWATNQ